MPGVQSFWQRISFDFWGLECATMKEMARSPIETWHFGYMIKEEEIISYLFRIFIFNYALDYTEHNL